MQEVGKVQFDNKISLGHLLTAAGMLIAGVVAYATLTAQQEMQSRRLDKIESVADAQALRLQKLEVTLAGQTSDLRNIQIGITEIKAALDKLANGGVK